MPVLIRCLLSPHTLSHRLAHVCSGVPPVIIPDDVAAGYVADAPPLLLDDGVDTTPKPSTGKVRARTGVSLQAHMLLLFLLSLV